MKSKGSGDTSDYKCLEPGCKSNVFSNKSNLAKHIKKHGPKVPAACGKEFPNEAWNLKRHESTCQECQRRKDSGNSNGIAAKDYESLGNPVANGICPQDVELPGYYDVLYGQPSGHSFDPVFWTDGSFNEEDAFHI